MITLTHATWTDTRALEFRVARLGADIPRTASVVVVGGGVVGLAIAWNLGAAGEGDVVLVERSALASGATGRCGAGVRQQWGSRLNCWLARESVRRFEVMDEVLRFPGGVEFRQGGYLILATTPQELEGLGRNVRLQNGMDIPSRLIHPEEARRIAPLLFDDDRDGLTLLGAAFCPTDGHANPFRVTWAYALACLAMGVEVRTGVEVTAITTRGGRVDGVVTTRGAVSCERVVLACGPWTPGLCGSLGVWLPVRPERHQILVTEPVERVLDPMVISFRHGLYCQQTPHGSFVIGMGEPDDEASAGTDQRATWGFARRLSRTALTLLPGLAPLAVLRHWAGLYDMTPDAQPLVGPVGPDGLFVACGFSGHGFMIAPMVAELVASQVMGREVPDDALMLRPDRFVRGELVVEPCVV